MRFHSLRISSPNRSRHPARRPYSLSCPVSQDPASRPGLAQPPLFGADPDEPHATDLEVLLTSLQARNPTTTRKHLPGPTSALGGRVSCSSGRTSLASSTLLGHSCLSEAWGWSLAVGATHAYTALLPGRAEELKRDNPDQVSFPRSSSPRSLYPRSGSVQLGGCSSHRQEVTRTSQTELCSPVAACKTLERTRSKGSSRPSQAIITVLEHDPYDLALTRLWLGLHRFRRAVRTVKSRSGESAPALVRV